jgi:NAD(P)-dependent dehydrogenase (short-subunit alcohol dehydrogenase family)
MHFVKSVSVAAADMRPPVARPARVAISFGAFEEVFASARPPEGLARPAKVAVLDGFERTSLLRESTVNSIICYVNRSIGALSLSCFGKSTHPSNEERYGRRIEVRIGWAMSSQTSPRRRSGVNEGGDPEKIITDAQWRKVMATDADGVFFGCRAAIPHLEQTKGSIVSTDSGSGTGGDWSMSPYNAAKGAVSISRAPAMDLGKRGVRVNSVCPSLTHIGMTADIIGDKELLSKFTERIPLGRVCEPQEVATVITFLANEDASFMTGANVAVNGGVSASIGQPLQQ